MENASKALIIAGAILISILLISVGILVMQSTSGIQDQMGQQMDATEVQSFNAQFSNYTGNGRSASQVKSLYERVIASNAKNSYQVTMTINGEAVNATAIANLSTRDKFLVVIDDTDTDGVLDTITVTTASGSGTTSGSGSGTTSTPS